MKKVLLLGDSIRMGYDDYVKEELKECEVIYNKDDNGRFITYNIWMFNNLNSLYGPFDIVHFNSGYWDMNRDPIYQEVETPIEDYIHNLHRLIRLIRQTKAVPIFALTTPIYDTPANEGEYMAINYKDEWVKEYNEAAKKVMKEENVKINDLYSLMLKEDRYGKCYDSLHLSDEAYHKCALEVSRVIREVIKEL